MLKLKELREEAQLTQKQLAEKISNMQRNVSNWELGVSEPDLKTVLSLANIFNVSLDELFGREPREKTFTNVTDEKIFEQIKRLSPAQKNSLYEFLKQI